MGSLCCTSREISTGPRKLFVCLLFLGLKIVFILFFILLFKPLSHGNAMDDMLGALLDMDESVAEIMKWIDENGGYEKNALFVTADHDHYLTLLPHFPEVVANMIIDGHTHDMTPENNTSTNTWDYAIQANRHNDDTKTQASVIVLHYLV